MTYQHALAKEFGTIRSTLLRSGFHLGTNLHQFTQNTLKVPNWFLDNLQPILVKPFLDQVPNKVFALLAAGQFETRLQKLGLRGS